MPDTLRIGDTVKLKSGGPPMTVSLVGNEQVNCDWFDLHHQAHTKAFKICSIVKENDPVKLRATMAPASARSGNF